jgi:Co/Zn/Cd efflux system component
MKNEKKGKKRKKHTFGWQKFLLLLAIYKHLFLLFPSLARLG